MNIKTEHNYSSVYMVPQPCRVKSRKDCNIEMKLGNITFRNPIIPSDMPAVVDFNTCEFFAKSGMFYVMHRFGITEHELTTFIKYMNEKYGWSSISIGIKESDRKFLLTLKESNIIPTYINIDVAHAYSNECYEMTQYVKSIFPLCYLIAGNVSSYEGVNFLNKAGADIVRIFIAPGSGCLTKNTTGFYRGSIELINECYIHGDCPVIADGGITEPGDVAKAIGAGAYAVMAGGIFAGHNESPGKHIVVDGKNKYCYYGNASYMNKGVASHIEGRDYLIDSRGSLINTISYYEDSLRSSVSYSGNKSIEEMCGNCEFIEIKK